MRYEGRLLHLRNGMPNRSPSIKRRKKGRSKNKGAWRDVKTVNEGEMLGAEFAKRRQF